MSDEEIMNIYCQNTPFVSDELQKALLKKAREADKKRVEIDLLKHVLREGKIHE